MHIPLMAEQEFDPASSDVQVRLAESEDLIGLAIREEEGEVRRGDGDILGLHSLVAFPSETERDVNRVDAEGVKIIGDGQHFGVELLEVEISGAQCDHVPPRANKKSDMSRSDYAGSNGRSRPDRWKEIQENRVVGRASRAIRIMAN
jgi:hypothetical protein